MFLVGMPPPGAPTRRRAGRNASLFVNCVSSANKASTCCSHRNSNAGISSADGVRKKSNACVPLAVSANWVQTCRRLPQCMQLRFSLCVFFLFPLDVLQVLLNGTLVLFLHDGRGREA
jgi:hypothetical protein